MGPTRCIYATGKKSNRIEMEKDEEEDEEAEEVTDGRHRLPLSCGWINQKTSQALLAATQAIMNGCLMKLTLTPSLPLQRHPKS